MPYKTYEVEFSKPYVSLNVTLYISLIEKTAFECKHSQLNTYLTMNNHIFWSLGMWFRHSIIFK